MRPESIGRIAIATFLASIAIGGSARADQVVADDLIVQGGFCVGFDCVDGEAFSNETIRLKENNLRIKFEDTSPPGPLPTVDWQITANDSANGGANRFSFDDVTGSTVPLWIGGGAPTDSIYLATAGFLGVGTSEPQSALHVGGSLRIDGDLVVTGGLRAGRVSAASLSEEGRATVTFAVPYARDYAITLTPVLATSKRSASAIIVSRDETGFTLAVGGDPSDYVEIVWTTRFTGEF